MKIAIILPQLEKHGGAERVISYLANYWASKSYQVMLITFNKQQSICYQLNKNIKMLDLINQQNTKLSIIKFFTYIVNLRKLLVYYKVNIAIGVDIKANLILRLASFNITQLITIATEHRHPPLVPQNKLMLKIIRRIYSNMHAVVALTKEGKSWFKKYTKFKQVALIANPLIYPLINIQPIVLLHNIIKSNKKTLLAVGRLHQLKNFDLLISIFAKLITKHNDWQLVIVGEGKQRKQLELQIQKLNLGSNVFLLGAVGNIADWYKQVDLFVLCSQYECLPYVLMEAMAYGLPVVSFDCKTGPSDIITHGVDGLLIENGNAEKLTKALDQLMTNAKLCLQFSRQAIKITHKFNIDSIAKQWDSLFTQLKNNV